MLSMSQTPLPHTGSWTLDSDGPLRLSNRPLTLRFHQLKNGGSRTHIGRDLTYSRADSYYLDTLSCHDSRIRHQHFHLAYEDFMTIFEEQERKFPPLNNVAPNEQTSCEMVGESATSGISQHLTVKKRRTISSVNTSIPSLDLLQMSVQTLRASFPNIGPPIQRQCYAPNCAIQRSTRRHSVGNSRKYCVRNLRMLS